MKKSQKIVASLFGVDGQRKYLTTSEIRRFLFHAQKQDSDVALLCQVLVYSGCRLSEALQLTRESLDLEAQALTFRTLKQRRANVYRQVPVPAYLLKSLQLHLHRRNSQRLWSIHRQTARRWVGQVMTMADLSGCNANSRGLRHGFAIGCVEEDIPITTLKKWLGHARLSTTAIYTDALGAEELALAARRWSAIET